MQNLGLWGGMFRIHLLQKQHESVFLVVKSYKMRVSGGGVAYIYIYMYMHIYKYACVHRSPHPRLLHTFVASPLLQTLVAGLCVEYCSLQQACRREGLSQDPPILLQALSQKGRPGLLQAQCFLGAAICVFYIVYVHLYIYTYICICMYLYMGVYTDIYIYIYMLIYVCTRTPMSCYGNPLSSPAM